MTHPTRPRALLLTALLAGSGLAIASCDDEGPPAVGRIAAESSVPAAATVGSAVSIRLIIEDESGSPLEGVLVELEVVSGEGAVAPDTATTDVDGMVRATWTLGTGAGGQTLRATARGREEVFSVTAEAGPPTRLEALSQVQVVGSVARELPAPVRVRLIDRYENPVPGRQVTFRIQDDGGGAVSDQAVTSDEEGVASSRWTLGARAGTQRLYAHSQGVALVEFRATAQAGAPGAIRTISGDSQSVRVGRALAEPLVVRVTDEYENPVPGVEVSFSIVEGEGTANPSAIATGSDGRAFTTWTLGTTVRSWELEATVDGVAEAARFQAQSVPGPPDALEVLAGDGQEGYAESPLGEPVAVRVSDEYGNPVPFAAVQFQDPEGGGSASPAGVTADGQGRAETTWVLGPSLGAHRLQARSGSAGPVELSATATSFPPAEVRVLSGGGQTAQVASQLPEVVTLEVLDRDQNPVAGADVEISVGSGGGSVSQSQVETDASGRAQTAWTLGTAAGEQSLEVRVATVDEPLTVTATATPGPPAALTIHGGNQQSAPTGRPLADPVEVRAEDEYGNGVSGVEVSFAVTAGGGSVSPAASSTDGSGLASAAWTLGPQKGANALTASAAALGSVAFAATALEVNPAAVEALSGGGQTGQVASELADPVRVRVLDEDGEPLEGASVEFHPSGSQAAATPAVAVTDGNGEAETRWSLATGAGQQTLEARVDGVDAPATFTATADPGPPAEVRIRSGDGQTATPGARLDDPLVVRVADAWDNPVPNASVAWRVTQGNGTLTATSSATDAGGETGTFYTAGTSFGEETVEASVQGLNPVGFTALVGNNLELAGVYVTQAAQNFQGTSALVADRPGLLRVFVRAGAANSFQPDVRVSLYQGGSLLETHVLQAGESSVRTQVSEATLAASWNVELPADMIQPGLGVQAEIDPENLVGEVDETDNLYPSGGGAQAFDVRELETFRTRMVPIDVNGMVGRVDEDNMHDFMTDVYAMMPMPDYDVDLRAVYTFTPDADGNVNWGQLIQDVLALQRAEGTGRYYYGVIRSGAGAPFCGLGYLGLPTSLGVDTCGAGTAAHEWGHNWDRLHAPCGNPGGPDPNYPYPDASIGVWGLDPFTNELRDPGTWKDLMSYCGPEWVSDYTYDGVFSFRENEAAQGASIVTSAEPSLILWGRVSPEGLVLEPAFTAETRPSLPREDGPYRVSGLAADGSELFGLSFAPAPLDHPDEAGGQQPAFAFAVPLSQVPIQALDRLRLEGPGQAAAVRSRSAALSEGEPELAAVPVGAGRVRLTWSDAVAPLVVVRDPGTGQILSFARGGEAVVRTDLAELDLELAGGVGSVRRVVEVR